MYPRWPKRDSGKAVSLADGDVIEVRVVKTAVSLGDASAQLRVSSYDVTRFAEGIGIRIDGVIGQDFIWKFSGVLIDYVRHRITLIEWSAGALPMPMFSRQRFSDQAATPMSAQSRFKRSETSRTPWTWMA